MVVFIPGLNRKAENSISDTGLYTYKNCAKYHSIWEEHAGCGEALKINESFKKIFFEMDFLKERIYIIKSKYKFIKFKITPKVL